MSQQAIRVGIVAIGRNEGERLVACLESARAASPHVVYVDSGSSDGSPERAAELSADVVELDPGVAFTAARGRNAGFHLLLDRNLELVQFVDGDCAIEPGWIEKAVAFLDAHPDVDVVCGRRRERFPEASAYNRLADIEWDTPVGEAEACGGDALMRAARVAEVGGYDETLIAGEDPELCHRIRSAGGRIWRIDAEMTRHDAALTHFSQWWRRMTRSGHAYAEFAWRHRHEPAEARARQLRSIVFWTLGWAAAVAAAGVFFGLVAAAATGLVLVAQAGRIFLRERRVRPAGHAALFAAACVIGKFAELQGALQFAWTRLRGRAPALIEYKGAGGEPPAGRGPLR